MSDFRDFDILLLPGWHNSGADHWQTAWEKHFPTFRRVRQADWDHPTYADWADALSQAVEAATRPVILVAHSLGTSLATRWAIETGGWGVSGALLVATTDRDRWEAEPGEPQGFAPMVRQPLPFPATIVASTDDPRCDFARAQQFAEDWRTRFVDAGALGHIGSAAKLGLWPEGLIWLGELLGRLDMHR